jgi:hypothetical protein
LRRTISLSSCVSSNLFVFTNVTQTSHSCKHMVNFIFLNTPHFMRIYFNSKIIIICENPLLKHDHFPYHGTVST